ncbi:MAG: NfeD family protein [Planctomycetota bacterium]
MPVWIPILLFLAGLALIVAEVFFPSMGLISLIAAGFFAAGIYLSFEVSSMFGWISLLMLPGLGIGVYVLAMKWLPHTPFGRKMLAEGPSFRDATTRRGTDLRLERFRGQRGVTVNMLRPSGTAEILGERVDVITRGEMVDGGTEIEVVEISGNRVIVASVATAATPEFAD